MPDCQLRANIQTDGSQNCVDHAQPQKQWFREADGGSEGKNILVVNKNIRNGGRTYVK